MNNAEYWKRRMKLAENSIKDKVFDEYVRNVSESYEEAIYDIDTKIMAWYQRFADNNELSFADAQKLLKTDELKEFKWTVEEYIKYGMENGVSADWSKELENASARVHISRLESLKFELRAHAERLTDGVIKNTAEGAKQAYIESYERTMYELQRGVGVGFSFQHIDEKKLERLLDKPWTADGKTFKAKCWTDKNKLVEAVGRELTRMAATGESPRKAIDNISRLFGTSKKNASRLIMTESTYFSSLAQKDCYNELDVEEFEVVGTFDKLMCDWCGDMDGKVFPMSKFEPGTTAPPFHPWCRCTTVPYFEDMENVGERFARDTENGKVFYVPSDMTFEEWKENFVDKSNGSGIIALGSDKVTINSIERPIELPIEQRNTGKGNPNAVLIFGIDLNNRQKALLEMLPDFDSRITVSKKSVSMTDLSALTAYTGDEFAMFTKGKDRLIVRGNSYQVKIDIADAEKLAKEGYRWSGHTHPGIDFYCMEISDGDFAVWDCFCQNSVAIYNSKGDYRTFTK